MLFKANYLHTPRIALQIYLLNLFVSARGAARGRRRRVAAGRGRRGVSTTEGPLFLLLFVATVRVRAAGAI